MTKLDLEKLALFQAGQLPEKEKEEIHRLVKSGDKECRLAMEWLSQINDIAAKPVRRSLPDHLRQMAQRIYQQYQATAQQPRTGLKLAICIFDSVWTPQLVGVRPAVSDTRRLLYTSDGYEIDIETNPLTAGRHLLLGHITRQGQPLVKASVKLPVGRRVMKTETDELGVFSLRGLPIGEFEIEISTETDTITVAKVPVGI